MNKLSGFFVLLTVYYCANDFFSRVNFDTEQRDLAVNSALPNISKRNLGLLTENYKVFEDNELSLLSGSLDSEDITDSIQTSESPNQLSLEGYKISLKAIVNTSERYALLEIISKKENTIDTKKVLDGEELLGYIIQLSNKKLAMVKGSERFELTIFKN